MDSFESLYESKVKLIADLEASPSGSEWCQRYTELVDRAIKVVFDSSVQKVGNVPVAVVACGGYGRSEMAPNSDADICLIPLNETDPNLDDFIKSLASGFRQLTSSSLKLEIDRGYKLISDAPTLDPVSRSSLLDARLVAGSKAAFDQFFDSYWESFGVGEFIHQKLKERQAVYAKSNASPLVVCPDLRDGAGGLRDLHTANAIRMAIGMRSLPQSSASNTVLMARNLLHLVKGEKRDVLTHFAQPELAKMLGLTPPELMNSLMRALLAIHEEFEAAKDLIHTAKFKLSEGVVAISGEARVLPTASQSDAAVGLMLAHKLGLKISRIEVKTTPEINGNQAMNAVLEGEVVLRRLDQCGLLGQMFPELEACRTLVPDDISHRYSVFEHSMQTVAQLDLLRNNPDFAFVWHELDDVGILFLAALLHDIGKSDKSGPHSDTGAKQVAVIANRWGLDENRAALLRWLVQNHLLMSHTIRVKDVLHPTTATEFAQRVGSREQLAALTLLTQADASAVGPDVWTPAQQTFLLELFRRSLNHFREEGAARFDAEEYRRQAKASLKRAQYSEDEITAFTDLLPAHYLVSTPPDLLALHREFVHRASQGELVISFEHKVEHGFTELTVARSDSQGLLSLILGVLYAFDVNLISVRAMTTQGDSPIALDTFVISYLNKPVPNNTADTIQKSLRSVLNNPAELQTLLASKEKTSDLSAGSPEIHWHPGDPGILEVRAKRGQGLAYRISRRISECQWNIQSARVGQWAGKSTASFSLTQPSGKPISEADLQERFWPKVSS